jgi:ABC-type branched-subunit amino acid transport system substrate-binding protein
MAVFVGLMLAAAVTAGPAAATAPEVVVPRGQPVEVAFANDLTGFASSFGLSFANAVRMAVEAHPAIRGFPIQINTVDAPCGDAAADLAAARAIVANPQNAGVLGQLCSFGFDLALPVYESAGIVTITGSATADELPAFAPTVFNRTAVSDSDGFESWYDSVSGLPSDLAWQQAYSLQFGTVAGPFADLYYDAASLLIRNLQNVSRIDSDGSLVIDRAALAEAVRATTRFQGVTCRITLDPATGNRLNDPTAMSNCAAASEGAD